jgi:hypothetical protein
LFESDIQVDIFSSNLNTNCPRRSNMFCESIQLLLVDRVLKMLPSGDFKRSTWLFREQDNDWARIDESYQYNHSVQPLYVIFHAVEKFSNTLKQCLSKQLHSSETPSNEMKIAKVRKKLIHKQSIGNLRSKDRMSRISLLAGFTSKLVKDESQDRRC